MNGMKKTVFTVLSLFAVLPLLCGCIGGQSSSGSAKNAGQGSGPAATASGVEKIELASVEEMVTGAPLTRKYNNILISQVVTSNQVKTDYPEAARECKKQIVKQLRSKKSYKTVTGKKGKTLSGRTAVVDLELVDMRIASSTARAWGGVFAGSSFMDVMVKVRNGGNKQIVHQKLLSTSNSAWGATYSGGSTDQNLPADFGLLIGEYLSRIIPAR